ncbi:MAG: DUF3486 family protein [Rhizobiaceae bacterium]|nr:DUF3486 family protein [Rhizobiaceae bacterium]
MAGGRGRLSSIRLLPQEVSDIVIWAAGELQANNRTQLDIYKEFHARLEQRQRESRGELDFRIPSLSMFNRYSMELDATTREMNEAREMATAVLAGLDHNDGDDITKFVGEALKAAVMAMLRSQKGKLAPKHLQELANTMRMVASAQAMSAAERRKSEEENNERVKTAVEEVGRKAGVSQETLDEINRALGVV